MKTHMKNILAGRKAEPGPPPRWLRVSRVSWWLIALSLVRTGLTAACAAEPPVLPPLTTVSGSPRLPGKFIWGDLVTDNALDAQKFYSDLFGWTFYDYGGYFIGMNDERPLCGMFQRPRPKDRVAEPRWFGYISVSNVEKARRAVTRAGGRLLAEPKKMPKRGEQAVFADAEGAIFGVVKSSSGDPEDFLAEPGDWIWIQLLSRDARKAAEFYRAVAGYEVIENTVSNRASDYVLTSEGYARATVRTIQSTNAQMQPTWLPFVRVKNVTESLAQAKQLGGKVLIEPKSQVFDGKVAVIADPTGAAIGIMEWQAGKLKGDR
jgi:predicted enzyme related to lactoylglutathione lyase